MPIVELNQDVTKTLLWIFWSNFLETLEFWVKFDSRIHVSIDLFNTFIFQDYICDFPLSTRLSLKNQYIF